MEDPSQPPRDAPDRLGINRGPWDNEAWLFLLLSRCSAGGVVEGYVGQEMGGWFWRFGGHHWLNAGLTTKKMQHIHS
jgi:hypothetical protein